MNAHFKRDLRRFADAPLASQIVLSIFIFLRQLPQAQSEICEPCLTYHSPSLGCVVDASQEGRPCGKGKICCQGKCTPICDCTAHRHLYIKECTTPTATPKPTPKPTLKPTPTKTPTPEKTPRRSRNKNDPQPPGGGGGAVPPLATPIVRDIPKTTPFPSPTDQQLAPLITPAPPLPYDQQTPGDSAASSPTKITNNPNPSSPDDHDPAYSGEDYRKILCSGMYELDERIRRHCAFYKTCDCTSTTKRCCGGIDFDKVRSLLPDDANCCNGVFYRPNYHGIPGSPDRTLFPSVVCCEGALHCTRSQSGQYIRNCCNFRDDTTDAFGISRRSKLVKADESCCPDYTVIKSGEGCCPDVSHTVHTAQPSGWKCCYGKPYDPQTSKCCALFEPLATNPQHGNQAILVSANIIPITQECCGDQGYDPATSRCCLVKQHMIIPEYHFNKNFLKTYGLYTTKHRIIPRHMRCCENIDFDPSHELCCTGITEFYSTHLTGDHFSANPKPHSVARVGQHCCDGTAFTLSERCCASTTDENNNSVRKVFNKTEGLTISESANIHNILLQNKKTYVLFTQSEPDPDDPSKIRKFIHTPQGKLDKITFHSGFSDDANGHVTWTYPTYLYDANESEAAAKTKQSAEQRGTTFTMHFDHHSFPTGTFSISVSLGRFLQHPPHTSTEHCLDSIQILLIPAPRIAVDANRDGDILFDDPEDLTTAEKPYRFWLNNNHDKHDDKPNASPMNTFGVNDFHRPNISSLSDLEDFTRLNLLFETKKKTIEEINLRVGFKWKKNTGALINLRQNKGFGSRGYLSDITTAKKHISNIYPEPYLTVENEAQALENSYWRSETYAAASFELDKDLLPHGHFLFEAGAEGKGELVAVVMDTAGEVYAESNPVHLELMDIRRMYQRFAATPEHEQFPPPFDSDTNPPFAEGTQGYFQDPKGFFFRKPHDETDQCIIFVHGWDVKENDFIWLSALNMKRLWHMGYKGRFVAFRWDTYSEDTSPGGPLPISKMTFNRSEYRAWKYGLSLAKLIQHLKTEFPHVDITAHSMGNIVVLSALRYNLPGATVRNYVMQNAALSASAVDTNPSLQFFTEHETKDYYRGYIENSVENGSYLNFYNFYLTGDIATNYWYMKNQENYRPNRNTSPNSGYSIDFADDEITKYAILKWGKTFVRHVTEDHEYLSFVTRSRTFSIGVESRTRGMISSTTDLHERYSFGDKHGAQFDFAIQIKFNSSSHSVYDYYHQLFSELTRTERVKNEKETHHNYNNL